MDAKTLAQERKRRRRATLLKILGFVSYFVGVASVFAYPQLAHKTYISENALIPGSATIEYSEKDFTNAGKYSRELFQLYRTASDKQNFLEEGTKIIEYLRKLGIESYIHKYEYYDSMSEKKELKTGFNIYCISRAPKSQGTESIVVSTTYNTREEIQIFTSNSNSLNFVSGFGLGISILKLLQDKKWRAKDILFIASDSKYGHHGIRYWLDHYSTSISSSLLHNRNISNADEKTNHERIIVEGDTLIRSGNIQAALHLDIEPCSKIEVLSVLAEGANGQLPNLDLVNTVFRIARKDGFRDHQLSLNTLRSGYRSGGIEGITEVYNWIDKLNSYSSEIITMISTNLKQVSGLAIPIYPVFLLRKELNTLLTFMLHQAIGIPTDDHGFFNLYHIDAITLSNKASSAVLGNSGGSDLLSMVYFGRAVEGTIRSLNNLIEHLHQSFYYYLLPSPVSYISIGDYMISFGLIMLGFFAKMLFGMIEVALASDPNSMKAGNKSNNSGPVKSLTIVGTFYVFGIVLFATPFIIQFIANEVMQLFIPLKDIALLWLAITVVLVVILFQVVLPAIQLRFNPKHSNQKSDGDWINIKVFGYVPCLLFISACSLLNFSFCLLVAVVIVPVYTFVEPIYLPKSSPDENSNVTSSRTSLARKLRNLVQLVALIAFSPVSLLAFGAWYIHTYNAAQLSAIESVARIVAVIIEQYQMYSNLTFPFLSIVYIPFNLLAFKVLLHK